MTLAQILVLEGDTRQEILKGILKKNKYELITPKDINDIKENNLKPIIIFAPVLGTNNGMISINSKEYEFEEFMTCLNKNSRIIIGRLKPEEKKLVEHIGIEYMELLENNEFAILNSIPTAEGAIKMAIEKTEITLHGSNCLVTGFGIVAKTLARMLSGIGATVYIAARNKKDLTRAFESRYNCLPIKCLRNNIGDMDYIFNTVPSIIFTRDVLKEALKSTFFIELASLPGGFDKEFIKEQGLTLNNAPGLPGKVAPKSAAEYIYLTSKNFIERIE